MSDKWSLDSSKLSINGRPYIICYIQTSERLLFIVLVMCYKNQQSEKKSDSKSHWNENKFKLKIYCCLKWKIFSEMWN